MGWLGALAGQRSRLPQRGHPGPRVAKRGPRGSPSSGSLTTKGVHHRSGSARSDAGDHWQSVAIRADLVRLTLEIEGQTHKIGADAPDQPCPSPKCPRCGCGAQRRDLGGSSARRCLAGGTADGRASLVVQLRVLLLETPSPYLTKSPLTAQPVALDCTASRPCRPGVIAARPGATAVAQASQPPARRPLRSSRSSPTVQSCRPLPNRCSPPNRCPVPNRRPPPKAAREGLTWTALQAEG
jgi:hypothetical protein